MSLGERYRSFAAIDHELVALMPSDADYETACAELGPWADDEQITRRAYEIRDARRAAQ